MYQDSPYESNRDNVGYPCCWETVNDCFSAHFHRTIEIFYVKEGELEAIINGQTWLAGPGCFILSSSYFIHSYSTRVYSKGYVLTVPYDAAKPYHSLFSNKVFASPFLPASPDNEELISCMEALRAFSSSLGSRNPLTREAILIGYTNAFLGLLIDRAGLADSKTDKVILFSKDILRYLQENYSEPLTLETVSRHFGYSKSRFSHIFNQYFGCSLTAYINNLRCRHACKLLKEKNDSTVTDISLACGFDSTRTFYRLFKSYAGVTPTEYARTVRDVMPAKGY